MQVSVTTQITDWKTATVDELARPIAEVIRAEIAAAIRALPGNRWDKTGHLVDGLRIEQTAAGTWAVYPPADRLRTPELIAKLIADVPLIANPLASPRVQSAIAEALARAVSA